MVGNNLWVYFAITLFAALGFLDRMVTLKDDAKWRSLGFVALYVQVLHVVALNAGTPS